MLPLLIDHRTEPNEQSRAEYNLMSHNAIPNISYRLDQETLKMILTDLFAKIQPDIRTEKEKE